MRPQGLLHVMGVSGAGAEGWEMEVLTVWSFGILFYFTLVCLRAQNTQGIFLPKKISFKVIAFMFSNFKYDNYFQKNGICFYYRMLFYVFRKIAEHTILMCAITVEMCIWRLPAFSFTPFPPLQLPGMHMLTLELTLSQYTCGSPQR